MIKKLALGLFLGICLTALVLQEDPAIKKMAGAQYKQLFEQALDCHMTAEIERISFFSPCLVFKNVEITPRDQAAWSWKCERYTTGCSLFNLLRYGMIGMHITIDKLVATTASKQGVLSIDPHIRRMMQGTGLFIPTLIEALTLNNATLNIHDEDAQFAAQVVASSESQQRGQLFKSVIHLHDGTIAVGDRVYSKKMEGTIDYNVTSKPTEVLITAQTDCRFTTPHLDGHHAACFLTGSWEHGRGKFALKNASETLKIDSIDILIDQDYNKHLRAEGAFPLEYVWRVLYDKNFAPCLTGQGQLQLDANVCDGQWAFNGHLGARDVQYAGVTLCSQATTSFGRDGQRWNGSSVVRHDQLLTSIGSWQWDEVAQRGQLVLQNELVAKPLSHAWYTLPRDITCSIARTEKGIQGNYKALSEHQKLATSLDTTGIITVTPDEITTSGTINKRPFEVNAYRTPSFALRSVNYRDEDGKPLFTFEQYADKPGVQAQIWFPLIRLAVRDALHYDVQGEGMFEFTCTPREGGYVGAVTLHDGSIRLPETYNFMNSFSAEYAFDAVHNKLRIDNLACGLYKGSLMCNRATVFFDGFFRPTFAHAPVLMEHCLLNMRRDLFAVVSGTMAFTYQEHELPQVKGRLMIEQAQLTESLFSHKLQKDLFAASTNATDGGTDMACDIAITTRNPIRVKTSFIETNATVDMMMQKTLREPKLSGSIELASGTLAFPYKPLHITKGHVYFLPDQQYDPLIELTAKNKIKKHDVTMHVTGSVQNHHIAFESAPGLTEEEIASLLLVGSYGNAMNMAMPTLIMGQIKNALFNPEEPSMLAAYGVKVPEPFKNINVVPSLSDPAGRTGLRGALEIDVNDRWRAFIQKNLTEAEDARLEVEYSLSDDVSLRAVRDERCDVSGEVEVRWKFGRV